MSMSPIRLGKITALEQFDYACTKTRLVGVGLVDFFGIGGNSGRPVHTHLGRIKRIANEQYEAAVYIPGMNDCKRKVFAAAIDAHLWVVAQSKKDGILFHKRLSLLSPLEQLAACAEDSEESAKLSEVLSTTP